ncbi:MAG: class I SAM-dependent methyltransferase [Candidatus Daviesbacteria bacterium]|nr:class I SAM-dependent methyltransferase [Candidatus Daviesbacteria bacterium]
MIHSRRIKILESCIGKILPKDVRTILDIGCGDGLISSVLQQEHQTVEIKGIEVQKRNKCLIPCKYFNGKVIPYKDNSVDLCMIIDVLHHTNDIDSLLKEAARVSKRYIIIKDHLFNTKFDFFILKFMDWIGNKPYGVKLLYNYQREQDWKRIIKENKLKVIVWNNNLPLYSYPFNLIFGRNIHLLMLLKK